MATAFVALGSNLGDRKAYLSSALKRLEGIPQTRVIQISQWYETDSVGGPPQGSYLNGVAELQTGLDPATLLSHLQGIERAIGRPAEHVRWGPRIIDLDLLSFDAVILKTPALAVPHPRMHERRFVLVPLAEIAPEWVHPELQRSVKELLEALSHADYQTSVRADSDHPTA